MTSDGLMTQPEAARYLGVSVATLRRMKGVPKVELPSPTGGKPLLRYDPQALRLWWTIQAERPGYAA